MKIKIRNWLALFSLGASFCFITTTSAQTMHSETVLHQMEMIANWQLKVIGEGKVSHSTKDWTSGVLYAGIQALSDLSKNDKYELFLLDIGQVNRWDTGLKRLYADDYCVAQVYTQLFQKKKDPEMIAKWRLQADSLVVHAFSEPLEWKDKRHYREWVWCDALFMGPPALAYLSSATGEQKYLEKADTLWWKTSAYLFDKKENLFYRDSRFFDQREPNGQKVFWARGNGWVLAGLVRMMDNMPKGFKNNSRYEEQFKQMAERISCLQQSDGSWHASLLDPDLYSIKESSGTGLYCYALAWGINRGLLDRKKYLPVVEKAWQALVSATQPDGKLGFVQPVGDRPSSVTANSSDIYGVGAFLLAGSQIYQMNLKK